MKNPLLKRIPREIKSDLGKYLGLFLFMAVMIVVLLGNGVDGTGTVSALMLLIFVALACVPVFLAHEKHD